jgi:hypothetical protein
MESAPGQLTPRQHLGRRSGNLEAADSGANKSAVSKVIRLKSANLPGTL